MPYALPQARGPSIHDILKQENFPSGMLLENDSDDFPFGKDRIDRQGIFLYGKLLQEMNYVQVCT